MNWMKDTYETLYGYRDINASGCVTGKSLILGGISGRTESTGFGAYICIREFLNNSELMKKFNLTKGLKGKTFIIQGYGNVGYWLAHYLVSEGAKMIGVVEWDGSLYNEKGIDPDQLYDFKVNAVNHGVFGYI